MSSKEREREEREGDRRERRRERERKGRAGGKKRERVVINLRHCIIIMSYCSSMVL